jgi:hypothetical protein
MPDHATVEWWPGIGVTGYVYQHHGTVAETDVRLVACSGPVSGLAQSDLLSRVPQLQETARRASTGVLGDGIGPLVLITSRGEVKGQSASDPIHVFGKTIRVSDLLTLLNARAAFLRTGVVNPMSGHASDLSYVVLYTLSLAKDPESVPVVAELLHDTDDVIRGWAAIALYQMAGSGDELLAQIRRITFPIDAVRSAQARGIEPPAWVKRAP